MKQDRLPMVFLGVLYGYYLISIGSVQLVPDEAYYWNWAKHLDLSYFDHPPMIAYIIAFFTWIGGDTEFFVRIGGLLCSIASVLFIALTVRALFPEEDKRVQREVAVVVCMTLLFSSVAIVHTPDSPMLLCWSAAVYFGSLVLIRGDGRWWYCWGAAVGLGLLSKYTMALIVPCLFAFLLFSKDHRFWLFRKEPYLAFSISIAFFSPVILWNWQHDWVSFAFQLNQGLGQEEDKEMLGTILEYTGSQAGVITPLLFTAFIYYSLAGIYHSLRKATPSYLYLILLAWPIILFFGYSSLKGETAEANWPAPAYISGLTLMWVVYHRHYRSQRRHRIFMRSSVAVAMFITLSVNLHLHYPFIPIPPDSDLMRRFHSWRSLGEEVERYIEENPRPNGYFLVSDKGTTLAEALFYTGNRHEGIDFTMPQRYLFLKDLDRLKGKNALLISHKKYWKTLSRYGFLFEDILPVASHRHMYRKEEIKQLSTTLYLGTRYRGSRHLE